MKDTIIYLIRHAETIKKYFCKGMEICIVRSWNWSIYP